MNINRYLQTSYLPALLIVVMLLTRLHHFGDALHLPDASLAVFFFAGFYRNKIFFAILVGLAAGIDHVAIANGTSGWCVSPAYVFLLPTYAVMWFAGRYSARLGKSKLTETNTYLGILGLLILATSLAFLISNGSFYLFSGRYPDLSWLQYLERIAHYYPFYLSSTLIYSIVGFGLAKLIQSMTATAANHKTA